MDEPKCYSGLAERPEGRAQVSITASPTTGETEVVLSAVVVDRLRGLCGDHFEHIRQCVWSGVAGQIATANVAGQMTRAGRTGFRAEVVQVELVCTPGREESGWLLTVAAMNAAAAFLLEFEAAGG